MSEKEFWPQSQQVIEPNLEKTDINDFQAIMHNNLTYIDLETYKFKSYHYAYVCTIENQNENTKNN